jgi:hypothetical protein
LSEDEYFEFQDALLESPSPGVVIPGGGGPRKVRWRISGRGKRGGLRIIYYWADKRGYTFLLTLYAKNEKADLTPKQLKDLREIVEQWL